MFVCNELNIRQFSWFRISSRRGFPRDIQNTSGCDGPSAVYCGKPREPLELKYLSSFVEWRFCGIYVQGEHEEGLDLLKHIPQLFAIKNVYYIGAMEKLKNASIYLF